MTRGPSPRAASTAAIALALSLAAWACKDSGDSGARGAPGAGEPPAAAQPRDPAVVPGDQEAPAAGEAAGPGARAPVDAEPSAEQRAALDEATAVMEEMGALAEKHADSCDRAAAALQKLLDERHAALERAEAITEDPALSRWSDEHHGPRLEAAESKLMPLIERCQDHEAMAEVFRSMN